MVWTDVYRMVLKLMVSMDEASMWVMLLWRKIPDSCRVCVHIEDVDPL